MLPAAVCFQPMIPLVESQTMAAVLRERLDYGRIRLWGSLAFILSTIGAGSLITNRAPDLVFFLVLGALAHPARGAGAAGRAGAPPRRGAA